MEQSRSVWQRVVAMLLAGACAGYSLPAQAQDGWMAQQVARLTAVPHTLQAVRDNSWWQIPASELARHPGAEDAYQQARPTLDALAETARPDLERELDSILKGMTYVGLQATATQRLLSYCAWIGDGRPDGKIPSASDLQTQLLAHCRIAAGTAITRLLDQHVDTLDLSLAAAPTLDLTYPRNLLADLATPDAAGHPAIDPLASQQSYQARLAGRLATAMQTIRQELDRLYAAQRWSGGKLTPPRSDCIAVLGPLSDTDLLRHCIATAGQWMSVTVQPAMLAAISTAVADVMIRAPSDQAGDVCKAALSPWMPGGGYPENFRAAITDACVREATRAIAQAAADRAQAIAEAVTTRAASLAAPILAAPPTYENLLAHAWFSQSATSWEGVVPSSYPEAMAARERTQVEYARLIAPASKAAVADAKKRIASAYTEAAGRAAGIPETRHLCGTNGQGGGLPPAQARSSLRDEVVVVCKSAFDATKEARARIALDRAGIRPDDMTLLLVAADGGEAQLLIRDVVTRAATAGLQVHPSAVVLGVGALLRITPMGADTPVLTGTVSREARGLRLSAIDSLPAWQARTFETVACLTSAEDDLMTDRTAAVFTIWGSIIASVNDRPRTADVLLEKGLARLQDVQDRQACHAARQAFIDRAPRG